MLQFVTVFAAAVSLSLAAPHPVNVFKIDISPEEAQQYLNSPPFNEPQLSGQTAVLPLVRYDSPQFRTAEAGPTLGHYWKNGREIENTDDYVEEVYDASQFHGQDGLGAYAYGYRAPESAKVENRARSGDVTGSYTYRAGNNDLIKVRYWADSEGFHQEDNLPKVELQPAQETEEVRQARLAHEKAWQEAASAAAQQPDPQGEYDQHNFQPLASEPQGVSVSAPGREGKAFPAQSNYQSQQVAQQTQYNQQSQKFGQQAQYNQQPQKLGQQAQYNQQPQKLGQQAQYSQQPQKLGQQAQYNQQPQKLGQQAQYSQQPQKLGQQAQYNQQPQKLGQQAQYSQQSTQFSKPAQYGQQQQQSGYGQQQSEEPEPTGPPRGFFYSFDYPVSIVVRKDAQGQNGPLNPGTALDHDSVGVNSQRYQ